MRTWLLSFSVFFTCFATTVASAETCKDKLKAGLTQILNTSNIDLKSATLASDVTNLLQPKFQDIIENDPVCKGNSTDLLSYNATTFSIPIQNHTFDIELRFSNSLADTLAPIDKPQELERLLPWYGILVVKKGSLDKYANSDTPIISTEYMKSHKADFFPANSDKALGMARACTHGNHTAHDKDVVNRAAHLTMNEKDSFWSGNDYYVYDGEDVYWGWASIAGEVALALATFGLSAEAQLATGSVAAASTSVSAAHTAITAVKLTKDSAKIQKAITAAKAAKAGKDTAAVTSRSNAIKALADAGITVKKGTRATELVKIGNTLENAASGIKSFAWTSALATGLTHPWRLVKNGITSLKPKNLSKLYGKGATWGQRFKTTIPVATVAGVSLWQELAKAWGYSTASLNIDDNVKFNSFGLLSADDLEGRENEVSHGAWLQFDEVGTVNTDDALHEALAFAEAFQEDMQKINTEDPQCDVDIYVVQPGISNPNKLGTREVYYIIQNPAGTLSVSTTK